MLCSSQPNRVFARAPTRIFVWRQSLQVGARADGTDPYGKSEPLRGARGGLDRRRVPAAQRAVGSKACREKVGACTSAEAAEAYRPEAECSGCGARRLEGRVHRGRCPEAALPLLRQELQLSHGPHPQALQQAPRHLDLLHQAHASQRLRRVRGRAVRRHPQDGLRVVAPHARHSVRLPGPDCAA